MVSPRVAPAGSAGTIEHRETRRPRVQHNPRVSWRPDGYSFAGFRAQEAVRGVFGDPDVRIVSLDRRSRKPACGGCGRVQKGWYDRRVRRVRDLPSGGFPIVLELEVRRPAVPQLRHGRLIRVHGPTRAGPRSGESSSNSAAGLGDDGVVLRPEDGIGVAGLEQRLDIIEQDGAPVGPSSSMADRSSSAWSTMCCCQSGAPAASAARSAPHFSSPWRRRARPRQVKVLCANEPAAPLCKPWASYGIDATLPYVPLEWHPSGSAG
jgi:hypothetical protein